MHLRGVSWNVDSRPTGGLDAKVELLRRLEPDLALLQELSRSVYRALLPNPLALRGKRAGSRAFSGVRCPPTCPTRPAVTTGWAVRSWVARAPCCCGRGCSTWASEDFAVSQVRYLVDDAVAAGSDRGLVVADLDG